MIFQTIYSIIINCSLNKKIDNAGGCEVSLDKWRYGVTEIEGVGVGIGIAH